MACDVEYTDEFGDWWLTLTEAEQEDVTAYVALLESRDAARSSLFVGHQWLAS